MRSFSEYNPIAVFIYYVCMIVPAMFCINPVIMIISVLGAAVFSALKNGVSGVKKALFFLVFPAAAMIFNPLFTHKGATTLFILNNNPITYESAMYGLTAGLMIAATLMWFTTFNKIMTSDKLLYIFGAVSPKIALILSMALRYIPLYGKQIKKISQAQKVMGLYKEDNAIDKIRGSMRIFSVMVSWALENGVITADSMTARGYGVGRRSRFAIFKWQKEDTVLTAVSLLLTAVLIAGMAGGKLSYVWYPYIETPGRAPMAMAAYTAYALMAVLPAVMHIMEDAKWRSLQSEI